MEFLVRVQESYEFRLAWLGWLGGERGGGGAAVSRVNDVPGVASCDIIPCRSAKSIS